MSEYPTSQEITCKKIQNYIFNFSDLLGQGNFSKVYRAHNEVTSKRIATQRRLSPSRSSSSTASKARN
jgi:predicted Ser/Thr protein kinase